MGFVKRWGWRDTADGFAEETCGAGTTVESPAGRNLKFCIFNIFSNKIKSAVVGHTDYLSVNQGLEGLRLVVSRAYVEDALFLGIGENCGRLRFVCPFPI